MTELANRNPPTPALSPEIRAAAARYLVRSGNADLLVVLGLAHDPAKVRRPPKGAAGGSGVFCKACNRVTKPDGKCRRRDCAAGPRGGAR